MNPNQIQANHFDRKLLNLNAVDANQLQQGVPGIGSVLANKIIDFRQKLPYHQFKNIDQVMSIPGIAKGKRDLTWQHCYVLSNDPVDALTNNFGQLSVNNPIGTVTISLTDAAPK